MYFLLYIIKTSLFVNVYQKDLIKDRSLIYGTMLLFGGILFSFADFANPENIFLVRQNMYVILSIVLFIDALYFYHFHTLPSIRELPMLLLAGDGAERSIFQMLNFHRLLFVLDLPFYYIFSDQFYALDRAFYHFRIEIFPIKITTLILFLLLLSLGVYVQFKRLDSLLYNRNVFVFHFKDISEIAFSLKQVPVTKDLLKPYWHRKHSNEMTGKAKGKNLLVIQLESFQNFILFQQFNGVEITPNLNRLIKAPGSHYFDRYFQSIAKGNTADAEFTTNHSLYPAVDFPSYYKYRHNNFFGLPKRFKNSGYDTSVFHGNRKTFYNRNKTYPRIGFEQFYSIESFDHPEIVGIGMDDQDFFRRITPILKEKQASGKPYYAFVITLTSHHPYQIPEELQTLPMDDEMKSTLFGNYLQAVHYVDCALGSWLDSLKQEGLLDNTILAIYGDHYGISALKEEEEAAVEKLTGNSYTIVDMMNIPLIIHFPDDEPAMTHHQVGSQMDFMPTMLNLFDLQDDEKALYFGQDLFHTPFKGFVAPISYTIRGSFITDEGALILNPDQKIEHAWFLPFDNQTLSNAARENLHERALTEITISNAILENRQEKEIP